MSSKETDIPDNDHLTEPASGIEVSDGDTSKSNGSKRRLNRMPKLPENKFQLLCEWGDCDVVNREMSTFFKHVSIHIKEYVEQSFSAPLNSGTCFTCGWQNCGAQILGSGIDFSRHVYFHCFHVRLKYLGSHQARSLNLGPCMLGSASCNWIPELPESLKCSWSDCKTIFDNPYIFYAHVGNHVETYADGKGVECQCMWTGCKIVVHSKSKLREHLRTHTQEKLVACPTCGGLFCSVTKLTDHILRQANSEVQRYECSHCNRRFSTERMLREHMRRHVNNYKCPLCEMTCPCPSALRQHVRYKHSTEKPFKCGHCEFSAKSSTDLRKHLDSHNVEDMFSCHIADCPFSARSYNSLALHFKKQHQSEEVRTPRYMCHVCKKTFGRGYPLTFHLKKKHQFQWSPGHSRFRYKLHSDGFFRLQTVRYESLDINQMPAEGPTSDTMTAKPVNSSVRHRKKKCIVATAITRPPSQQPSDAAAAGCDGGAERTDGGEGGETSPPVAPGEGPKKKKTRPTKARSRKKKKNESQDPAVDSESRQTGDVVHDDTVPQDLHTNELNHQTQNSSPQECLTEAVDSSGNQSRSKRRRKGPSPAKRGRPSLERSPSLEECPPQMVEFHWAVEPQNTVADSGFQNMATESEVQVTVAHNGFQNTVAQSEFEDKSVASGVQSSVIQYIEKENDVLHSESPDSKPLQCTCLHSPQAGNPLHAVTIVNPALPSPSVCGGDVHVAEYTDSAEANLHMLGDVVLTSLRVPKDKTPSSH